MRLNIFAVHLFDSVECCCVFNAGGSDDTGENSVTDHQV